MDENAKKRALLMIPYGLFVLGTRLGEDISASTVNWVTQVSFKPPLVVVGVKADSTSFQMVKEGRVFSLNVLGKGQKGLAASFFKPLRKVGNKFEDIPFYTKETGAPILPDATAFLECQVTDIVERGDHAVVVGEVINAGVHREDEPLTMSETGWKYGG